MRRAKAQCVVAGRVLAVEVVQPTKLNAELRDLCGSKLAQEHWPNVLEVRQMRKQLAEHLTIGEVPLKGLPSRTEPKGLNREHRGLSRAQMVYCADAQAKPQWTSLTVAINWPNCYMAGFSSHAQRLTRSRYGLVLHADASQG